MNFVRCGRSCRGSNSPISCWFQILPLLMRDDSVVVAAAAAAASVIKSERWTSPSYSAGILWFYKLFHCRFCQLNNSCDCICFWRILGENVWFCAKHAFHHFNSNSIQSMQVSFGKSYSYVHNTPIRMIHKSPRRFLSQSSNSNRMRAYSLLLNIHTALISSIAATATGVLKHLRFIWIRREKKMHSNQYTLRTHYYEMTKRNDLLGLNGTTFSWKNFSQDFSARNSIKIKSFTASQDENVYKPW